MNVPILSKRREVQRREVEDQAMKVALGALAKGMAEAGVLDPGAAKKGFLNGNAAQLSPGSMPPGAAAQMGSSWSNQSGTSNSLIARVTQNLSSGFGKAPEELELALAEQGLSWGPPFPPGRPLDPFWGVGRPPRTQNYSVGENVQLTPRWNRVSFATIKAIYEAYDVAQICVRHLINDVRSLDYNWEPIPGIKEDVSGDIEEAIAFFDSPDKRQPFRTWLAEWLQDVLRYDAGTLYIRRNEVGDPIALEVVDGTTMIPLVDFYGRRPEDEDDTEDPEGLFEGKVTPAFVQIIQGLPWDWLASNDLIYLPWNPLPESQYGLAPLEAVLLSANTDIRFQWHFLQFFTEGTLPAGFMEAPPDASDPAQLVEWQDLWDAVMLNDQTKLNQIRWVPSGAKFTDAKPGASTFDDTFPLYLMRRTCASFGCTPNDLGFTENVNKSSGDTQIDVQFRVGTSPLLRHAEDVINLFVKQHLKLRCRLHFDDGQETEDRVATATAAGIYLDHGVIGPDEVRKDLGLHVDKARPMPRYINNSRTGPIPLLSLESMAGKIDAETYGPADDQPPVNTPFSQAPGPIPPQGSPEAMASAEHTAQQARDLIESTTGEKSPQDPALLPVVKPVDQSGATVEGKEPDEEEKEPAAGADEDEAEGGEDEDGAEKSAFDWRETLALIDRYEAAKGADNTGGPGLGHATAVTSASAGPATTVNGGTDGITVETGVQGSDLLEDDEDDDDEVKKEYVALALRRWRDNSRNRMKKGRAPRRFVDPNMPAEVHVEVWAKLQHARSRQEVDAAFADVGKPSAGERPAAKSTPGFHSQADAIVEHYKTELGAAMAGMFSDADLDAAVSAGYAKGDVKKGVRSGMVSLDLPPGTFPSSSEGDHITIVFLGGQVSDETYDAVCRRAEAAAAGAPPPVVSFSGTGSFPASDASDGKVPVFAVPTAQGVFDWLREQFKEWNASEHADFHPHCTLAYAGPEEVAGWEATPLPKEPVLVAGLSVHLGDNVRTFPFSGGPPPNLRPAESRLKSCRDCCLFAHSNCVKYGEWDVQPGQTCDGWGLAIDGGIVTPVVPLTLEEKADAWSLSEDEMTAAQRAYVSKSAADAGVLSAVKKALKGKASKGDLVKLVEELYGDAMLTASHDAAHAAGGTIAASLQGVSEDVPKDYWTKWKPGFGEAASKAADGGMREMLERADLTIQGMSETTIDRIGTKIAEGLSRGDSMEATGKAIRELVSDPVRAEMIANTEYARATTEASLQTYGENDIEQVEWMAEGDACPECEENADASPIALGDDWPNGDVPVHPNCRCAIAPLVTVGESGEAEKGKRKKDWTDAYRLGRRIQGLPE